MLKFELYNPVDEHKSLTNRIAARQWHLMWNEKKSEVAAFEICQNEFGTELQSYAASLVGGQRPSTAVNILQISRLRKAAAKRSVLFSSFRLHQCSSFLDPSLCRSVIAQPYAESVAVADEAPLHVISHPLPELTDRDAQAVFGISEEPSVDIATLRAQRKDKKARARAAEAK